MPWAQPHAGVAEVAQLHVLERHLGASEGDPFSGFLLGHVRTLSCAAQQLLPCCRVPCLRLCCWQTHSCGGCPVAQVSYS